MIGARSATSPARKPRRRLPAEFKTPEILLISGRSRLAAIERALRRIDVRIRKIRWSETAPDAIDASTVAVVLAAPLESSSVYRAVRILRGSPACESLPVFAIVPDGTPEASIRRIYLEGITAVLLWPGDGLILAGLLAEMLALDQVRGRARRPDAALARLILARLRIAPNLDRDVRVQCRGGVAHVSGTIESLWQRRRIEEIVANVPGVKWTNSTRLHVLPSGRPDRVILRDIRTLMRGTSSIDESTISLSVRNGFVTLAGAAADKTELGRILGLIENVKGVRGIQNLTTVSPHQKEQDRTVARRVKRSIETAFPGGEVIVSVFGGTGVLAGRVGSLAMRRSVEEMVSMDRAIRRVINKIEVS